MKKKNKYKYQSLQLITDQIDSKYLLALDYNNLCTTYKDIIISQKEDHILLGGSSYKLGRNAWKNIKFRLNNKLKPDQANHQITDIQERTKTMNTELEMSNNYHHGQDPPLTPVHFNGGAYRQVAPHNHHQIPTHFAGTGYDHPSTPNRRVDMYPSTSPYTRTVPPPQVHFNDNDSVLGGSVSTADTNATVPSSFYEVMIREKITPDSHYSVNPTSFNVELIRSVCVDDPEDVYKIGIDKSCTDESCVNLLQTGLRRLMADKLHSSVIL